MNEKSDIIDELIENIDAMLELLENQESIDSDFVLAREIAEQLREEVIALQE